MWTYKARLNSRTYDAKPELIREYFIFVELITGLDEAAAKAIIHRGNAIRHPRAKFWGVYRSTNPVLNS